MGLLDGMYSAGGGFSTGRAPQTAASFFLGGGTGRKPRPTAPTLPTLEAPPTRDIRGEADTTGKTALASLLFNRLFGGSVQPAAALLGGMRKGYDSKFGNELADAQRTNQTALQQFGANQAGFANELRLDGMDRQEENDAWNRFRDNRNWNRITERDAVGDARFAENRDFQVGRANRADMVSDRQWNDFVTRSAQSKSAQDVQMLSNILRFESTLDPASQKAFRASVMAPLSERGVTLPDAAIKLAPKPVDPLKVQDLAYKKALLEQRGKELSSLDWYRRGTLEGKGKDRQEKSRQFDATLSWKQMDSMLDSWGSGTKQPSFVEIFKLETSLDEAERAIRADLMLSTPDKAAERDEALRQIEVRRAEIKQLGGQPVDLAPVRGPGGTAKPATRATSKSSTSGVIRDPSKVSTGGLLKRLAEKYGGK